MKEYSILIRNGSGSPYYLKSYNTLDDAKNVLYQLVDLEEERGRAYYVDNDFFKNKYHVGVQLKYMCIKEREVSNWEKYSKDKDKNKSYESNLIFYNFKK